jgi:hypothetical protein
MKKLNGSLLLIVACFGAYAPAATVGAAERTAFEMGAYTNEPGGSDITKGDYAAAIAAAKHVPMYNSETSLIALTNLCVAYTITRVFEKATTACDGALTLAKAIDASIQLPLTHAATIRALTNRGVLRAVSGDPLRAAADFRAASGMRGSWQAPGRNLAYLETLPADRVARAEPAID